MHLEREGMIFALSAPSGTGKTTLCQALLKSCPNLKYSVSFTTRPPRSDEKNGEAYHFTDAATFQRMIDCGDIIEWTEIYGKRYGTSRKTLETAMAAGKDLILAIDGVGVQNLKKMFPQAVGVFVVPPNLDVLKERLNKRGTESAEDFERRIQNVRNEIAHASTYDYLVINDDLEQAVSQLSQIYHAEAARLSRLAGAKAFLESFG